MAKNLQRKLPATDTLHVYDINAESTKRFADEMKTAGEGAAVNVASTVREASENSVSIPKYSESSIFCFLYMMSLFYP